MYSEELEMTVACAQNIQKHLVRILANRSNEALELQLHYVTRLIRQAESIEDQVLAVA